MVLFDEHVKLSDRQYIRDFIHVNRQDYSLYVRGGLNVAFLFFMGKLYYFHMEMYCVN